MKICFSRSLIFVAGFAMIGLTPATAGPPEVLERGALRVCADGNNLPFSNEAGEGFENKIAELMSEDIGLPLSYSWAPQVMGFVRSTLELRVCDVIIGVAAGYELVQNSNAYYHSVYSVVLPEDAEFDPVSLASEGFNGLNVGVVHDTPPVVPLRRAGAVIKPYRTLVDTRAMNPARDAVADVAEGVTDAAVIWGPIAGYYAMGHEPPLRVVPLDPREAQNVRLDYRITMGIRRNEPLWKDWINDFIARHQNEINEILADYGVPLLDNRGALVQAAGSGDGQ